MNLELVTNECGLKKLMHSMDLVHTYSFFPIKKEKYFVIPTCGDTIVTIGLVFNKCLAFENNPDQETLNEAYLSTRIPKKVVFRAHGDVIFVWKIEDKYIIQEIEGKFCVLLEIPFLTPGLPIVCLHNYIEIEIEKIDIDEFIIVHGFHNNWLRSAISWETHYIKSYMIPDFKDGTKAMIKIDAIIHKVPYEENPKYEFNPYHGDKTQQGTGNPHYKKLFKI